MKAPPRSVSPPRPAPPPPDGSGMCVAVRLAAPVQLAAALAETQKEAHMVAASTPRSSFSEGCDEADGDAAADATYTDEQQSLMEQLNQMGTSIAEKEVRAVAALWAAAAVVFKASGMTFQLSRIWSETDGGVLQD